MTYELISIMTQ